MKTSGQSDTAKNNKILFVVSNAHFYGESSIPTGNSFSEIVIAYDMFISNGYKVDFVSPKGGSISLSCINTSNELEKQYLYNFDFMKKLKQTKNPDTIVPDDYKAIYYPGGKAAMFGVPENEQIQKIAKSIYYNNGVVASVCHGTVGILNIKLDNNSYLIEGKNLNGNPEEYEYIRSDYFKSFPFLIKKTAESRGSHFKFSPKGKPHLEVDNRLITGQNPESTILVAEAIIKKIKN
ncbi:type 1 glutamine amidotransferase domain-containing protein [Yeosuana marina]|uniref:type 1 glutamine amidotransferase domain-containing protein n=1 Tax=Yeosuana marina TaxID=1565536 RepID=UPI001424612C|nr:type 1 glutamine amidotransferase domain-containing protein [Yeosuana marina]